MQQVAIASSIGQGGRNTNLHGRLRMYGVRLYARHDPLFFWTGKAGTQIEADEHARKAYAEALDAIFRAQGLTRSDATPALRVTESAVLANASQNAWRVTGRASYEAGSHPRAQRVLLGKPLVSNMVTSAAMTDPNCIAALQSDHALALGMWLSATGRDRLVDIDSCWFVTTPLGTVRLPHSNSVLRDVLRLLVLRGLSPRHETATPKIHPFAGPQFEVNQTSKTLLAGYQSRKPAPSSALVDWLEREGFVDAARAYRASYA